MKSPLPHPSGKSLIELLIVIVIVALLATLAFPLFGYFKAKASYVACISSMKSLHAGFASYLGDHQMIWPQVPDGLEREGAQGDMLAKFWYDSLKEYGITKKTWICPSDDRLKEVLESDDHYESTYAVTQYDEQPNRAYQWVSQPWITESGDFHGKGVGPNILFPDGRIERGIPLMPGR
jgi:type II secretory pathway pseudopilin PulG